MSDARLELILDDGIGWIVACNSARLNAFTASMWQALPKLLGEAEANEELRVIVLRGEGDKAFSAGADISEFESQRTGDNAKAYDKLNHDAFTALVETAKPVIAMVHGYCLGGGLGLAACCDLRLADRKAQFSIPAAKLGIGYNPRWVTPLLSLTSPANVREILFTGRRIKADEAYRMGLVNHLHDGDALENETRALAGEIAANAPLSVQASKLVIRELVHHPETPDLYKLDEAVQRCFDSEDYQEGRRAFSEKRKPIFRGR